MKPIKPQPPPHQRHLWRRVEYATNQPEYAPLVALIHDPQSRVLTRWQPTEEERQALIAGALVTLELLTFNQPLHPMIMYVDPTVEAAEPKY